MRGVPTDECQDDSQPVILHTVTVRLGVATTISINGRGCVTIASAFA